MTSKEEWQDSGKELAGAFKGLAKSIIRSAKAGIEKADEWASQDDQTEQNPGQSTEHKAENSSTESNVFNDGTWRRTGKNLGKAFSRFGDAVCSAVDDSAEKAEEWAEKKKNKVEDDVDAAAEHADRAAEKARKSAYEFAEGLKSAENDNVVCEAEVVSEEIISTESNNKSTDNQA